MISETRKKAVKAFNRRLKKATGIEKETLLEFVNQAGRTSSGNLSTKSIASTQTIKSFTRAESYKLPKKLVRYNTFFLLISSSDSGTVIFVYICRPFPELDNATPRNQLHFFR